MADGGTIFLDEIGEISQSLPGKTVAGPARADLREGGGLSDRSTLTSGFYRPTNKTSRGRWGRGASGRIFITAMNVFPIALPSLAERQEAIIPLAEYFVQKSALSLAKKPPLFTDDARSDLRGYGGPATSGSCRTSSSGP
jgi:transcriptional regulator with AAA-type ATPase domain